MPSTQVAAADGLHHEPFAHYCPNVVTRVMPFVAPICLLLTLFETPLSPRIRMSTVFHALADPIDFSWSLIHKVAAWTECYNLTSGFVERERLADGHIPKARVVATIIVGLDEIAGPRQSSHQSFLEAAKHYLLGTATSEFEVCCTPFAAVLLSWIVPLALLSGRIGALGSPRACLDAISRFVEGITAEDAMVKYRTADSGMKRLRHDIQGVTSRKYAEYHPSVDGYRPWKARSVNGPQQSTIPSTAFIAAIPLIISTATFVSLLWIAGPDSTTHQWFLAPVLLGIWVLSTLLSQGICYRVSYKHQWHVTIAKDVAVATLIVLAIILLSTASSINEANGSGIGSGPGADTEFGITINLLYEHGGVYRADYVSVLALCFGSQLCFYAAVVRKYRAGLMVMQWPEETRRLEYAQLETRTAAWAS
ncbi:hypothetical protein S40288_10709 [Stachybotrys chartarum IBT 40288]|nr:hypothetical protein S40288_10709 [Stachybotrys chartarum IBT 40288]